LNKQLSNPNAPGPAPHHDPADGRGEAPEFYQRQLVTYLGNKRQLLAPIARAVDQVAARTGKPQLRILDGFAGSGVVSRLLKSRASALYSNDLEPFAAAVGRCHLTNHDTIDHATVTDAADQLNRAVDAAAGLPADHPDGHPDGFIRRLYSPVDDCAITEEDRAFYTNANAARLDHYRQLLDTVDEATAELLLGPLLAEASVHANTAGVFKGFYKDRTTGRGKFGGTGGDALHRITGTITVAPPVLSRFCCDVEVSCRDINELVRELPPVDVAYFDPPYNQHPYGSNYFMLNLLTDYQEPEDISLVSGIPRDWKRSAYNRRATAFDTLADLLTHTPADFIVLSFNNEGLIALNELRQLLTTLGEVEEFSVPYNAFRGSRNLRNREIHVTEHLFLLERH
jgi:adenine-specific DNA-methyltransferase